MVDGGYGIPSVGIGVGIGTGGGCVGFVGGAIVSVLVVGKGATSVGGEVIVASGIGETDTMLSCTVTTTTTPAVGFDVCVPVVEDWCVPSDKDGDTHPTNHKQVTKKSPKRELNSVFIPRLMAMILGVARLVHPSQ